VAGSIAGFATARSLPLRTDRISLGIVFESRADVIKRTGKADRIGAASFKERFQQILPTDLTAAQSCTLAGNATLTVLKSGERCPAVEAVPAKREGEKYLDKSLILRSKDGTCEPIASPAADPYLAELSGRCFSWVSNLAAFA
jgi:hypothetical protein